MSSDWPRVRLHVVTGKGGTGKTTVAASLALALASQGKNVLVCEVEGRQGLARMFDVDPLPYAETLIATGLRTGPDGAGTRPGTVHALHIDPESALLEYLAMYYRLGRAGKALDRFGVIEFATTIAPGVRDVLLTGKVFEAVQRNSRNKGAIQYDAVVLDAPPTGRITQFLNVSDELAGLAKVGPIKSQADTMMTLFRSPRTAVLPDDALALAAAGKLDKEAVRAELDAVGVSTTKTLVDGLAAEARDHAERRALEESQRALVDQLGVPTYELERLAGGIDLGGLYDLAATLRDQGLA